MSFNGFEDALLARAISRVNEQLEGLPEYMAYFEGGKRPYLSWGGLRYTTTPEGKLTVFRPGTREVDERVTPANCYNLIEPGECIAEAVRRLELNDGYPPEDWELDTA